MTVNELKNAIEVQLQAGGCETPAFDALCLLEDIGGVGRGKVEMSLSAELPNDRSYAVLEAAKRRADGEPLQYILGTWDFLNLTLEVGEGVLIPRPETEMLCEIAAKKLSKTSGAHVLDLCAGTGCVGLGIASLKPDVRVTAVEVSEQALYYLNRNRARYPALSVTAQKADVLTDYDTFTEPVDAIVSNPPYIPDADMPSLQREVQHEPRLALAAGDGYRFYRVLAEHWTQRLKPNGFIAVEVGIGQSDTVESLFRNAGLHHVCSVKDFAGIPRVVFGRKE
ncbi:MAG: peptide chain release factor N(5)-glutamine methyltransferase [Clostridia bacterium]|nr:peptide chain release factor N(5)-glutamine methyltransferase [Clostridia bacterium]